jgi:hypothetical protein
VKAWPRGRRFFHDGGGSPGAGKTEKAFGRPTFSSTTRDHQIRPFRTSTADRGGLAPAFQDQYDASFFTARAASKIMRRFGEATSSTPFHRRAQAVGRSIAYAVSKRADPRDEMLAVALAPESRERSAPGVLLTRWADGSRASR